MNWRAPATLRAGCVAFAPTSPLSSSICRAVFRFHPTLPPLAGKVSESGIEFVCGIVELALAAIR